MTATMTLADIARMTGVARPAVNEWIRRFNAESASPFPAPYEEHDGRSYYAVADVQGWLRTTQLGHRATAVDDALFHSSLYQMLLSHPAHAALSLLQCSTGFEEPSLDSSTEVIDALTASYERAADSTPTAVSHADINEAAELVTEAAFTPAAVLARLAHDLGAQRQVLLSSRFSARVTSALKEALTVSGPAPLIIPTDEYSLGLVADLVRSLTEPMSLTIGYRKECAPASLFWAELACRNVEFLDVSEEIPSDSFIIHATSAQPEKVQEYFDGLQDWLDHLDDRGALLCVSSAGLLIEDSAAQSIRRRFLAPTETGALAPLRYSARLPRGIFPDRGQQQGALWIFKRPNRAAVANSADAPVVLADVPDVTAPGLISDWVTMLTTPDDALKHTFVRGRTLRAAAAWRSRTHSLDDSVFTSKPAVSAADLIHTAHQAGWDISSIGLEDTQPQVGMRADTESTRIEYRPWKAATNTRTGVLQKLSGSRIAERDLAPEAVAKLELIGEPEILGSIPQGARCIDRLRLEDIAPRGTLTEPGDVVFIKSPRPRALIDEEGGKLVTAPAQALRCRTFRGRSHTPLEQVCIPYLVEKAINEAVSSELGSVYFPVLPRKNVEHLSTVEQQLGARRRQLVEQLRSIDVLRHNLTISIGTGAVTTAESRAQSPPG
ncbi:MULTISPECIES: AlpA family transcriptional regulator [unclassified Corynebacterium]|uniref:helix-turn-helix transcriptional regulator n=1 Tax=unclassified Corynebacterium TaxID=2624378 RepID=UPI0008DAAC4E|nr:MULTISPECIES: hypothetical protein [unclassified Corynebacterium]MDK8245007.1 hypothetical protein [Corynebacterium sp. UMB10321]